MSWSELDNEKLTRIAMTIRNSCHLAVATLDLGYILCSLSRVMLLSRGNITGFSFFSICRAGFIGRRWNALHFEAISRPSWKRRQLYCQKLGWVTTAQVRLSGCLQLRGESTTRKRFPIVSNFMAFKFLLNFSVSSAMWAIEVKHFILRIISVK